jgi:hypothetical protein
VVERSAGFTSAASSAGASAFPAGGCWAGWRFITHAHVYIALQHHAQQRSILVSTRHRVRLLPAAYKGAYIAEHLAAQNGAMAGDIAPDFRFLAHEHGFSLQIAFNLAVMRSLPATPDCPQGRPLPMMAFSLPSLR